MERIEDLQFQNLKIIQDDTLPCFTQDSILLLDFAWMKPGERAIDLGCGNGILSILGTGRFKAEFTGIDCQPELIELARRSALLNGQNIIFHQMDVADAATLLGVGQYTTAICNPPYFLQESAGIHPERDRSRHGTLQELEQFCQAAFQLLNNRGRLFLCYPAEGIATIFFILKQNRLEPKRIQFVRNMPHTGPYLVLIEAMKLGKQGLVFEADRILSNG